MLEVLSAPEVEIIASLEAISHGMNDANEGGMVEKIGSGKYRVQELEMVQIAVRIRNRKGKFHLILACIPGWISVLTPVSLYSPLSTKTLLE